MEFKYGVYVFEELVEEFDTVEEADTRAEELRNETGLPYEVSTLSQEMTEEQHYWSMNGAFGAFAYLVDLIKDGRVHNLTDVKLIAISHCEKLSEDMSEVEGLTK